MSELQDAQPPVLANAFDEALQPVDIGASSKGRFDRVYPIVAALAGVPQDEVYVVGASTRVTNIPIRLTQGKARDRSFRFGLAVLGPAVGRDVPKAVKYGIDFVRGGNFDAVGVAALVDGVWKIEHLVTADPGIERRLRAAFPHLEVVEEARTERIDPRQLPLEDTLGPVEPGVVEAGSPIEELTYHLLQEKLGELELPRSVVISILAALRAGKHLILVGAPGTGKSTIAERICEAAVAAGLSRDFLPTTGTSDWTTADTIGAYRLKADRTLAFVPGLFLEAITRPSWLVIDELNRADIDKAIGPLFTVLAGQSVVLPFEQEDEDGELRPIAIVGESRRITSLEGHVMHEVPSNWRIVATMNDLDQDLLFALSQAFSRRFARIEIPVPDPAAYRRLLARDVSLEDADLRERLERLIEIPGLPLGPAILLDCARHLRDRMALAEELIEEPGSEPLDNGQLIAEAISLYVKPQLANIRAVNRQPIDLYLASVSAPVLPALAPPVAPGNDDDDGDDDEPDEMLG